MRSRAIRAERRAPTTELRGGNEPDTDFRGRDLTAIHTEASRKEQISSSWAMREEICCS